MHRPFRSSTPRTVLVLAALAAACASAPDSGRGYDGARIATLAQDQTPRTAPFDVEHYALALRIDPQRRHLQGTCRVRLWPKERALQHVELDLEGLTVARVLDAQGKSLDFRQLDRPAGAGALRIELGKTLKPGSCEELAIDYGGSPRKGLWFVRQGSDSNGPVTQVFTQGECRDARAWFPCFDEPDDRATSELLVELPPGWTSVAAGERVQREVLSDGWTSERWRMDAPHPTYLATLVAGELVERRAEWNGVPLTYLAPVPLGNWIEGTFEDTPAILGALSALTGQRYPFRKYSQACVPSFQFGGMENISATTLTDAILTDAAGRAETDAFGLIAHEAAHQWFGDLLTCRDWSHIWLNESFATYFALLCTERLRGEDAFRIGLRDMQQTYVDADVGAARRPLVWNVYKEPMDLFFGGQTYPGGGSRLHLLRCLLGDDAFFSGIARYVADNAGRSVTTEDFRRAMESASGRDLGEFFGQWLYGRGYPEFEVRWSFDAKARCAVVDIEQVQSSLDGTPAVFRVPARIEVRTRATTELHDVLLESRRQSVRLPCAEEPEWVRFDPQSDIPKKLNETRSVAEWRRIASADFDVNGRRDAIAVLGRLLEPQAAPGEFEAALDLLLQRLAQDDIGEVRSAAARALGRAAARNDERARRGLERSAAEDAEARVRSAALAALGTFPPDPDTAARARELWEGGPSWGVRAAAARLVARAEGDPERALGWLLERLDTASPHDALRAATLGAVAELGLPAAATLLRQFALDEAASEAARVAAVNAYGGAIQASASARAELEAIAAEAPFRLRGAAIEGLGRLGAAGVPRVDEALERVYPLVQDTRHRRAIERLLREPWARGQR